MIFEMFFNLRLHKIFHQLLHTAIRPSSALHPRNIFTWPWLQNVTVMTKPDCSALRTINKRIPRQNMTTSAVAVPLSPYLWPLYALLLGLDGRACGGVTPHVITTIDDLCLTQYSHPTGQFYSESCTQTCCVQSVTRSITTYYSDLTHREVQQQMLQLSHRWWSFVKINTDAGNGNWLTAELIKCHINFALLIHPNKPVFLHDKVSNVTVQQYLSFGHT